MAFQIPLSAITEDDLQQLVDNEVPEDREVEYKRDYPGGNDTERKEFLADVSACANTVGGRLIYGIDEGKGDKKGVPVQLTGVELSSVDDATRDLESRIRDGIRPRIVVALRFVPLKSGRHAIIMDIPRSYAAPHMVTFGGSGKFFMRESGGKHQLDVDELRAAFARSANVAERIRDFRRDRIAKVLTGETPVPLYDDGAALMLHLVPFAAFDPGASYRLARFEAQHAAGLLAPLYFGGTSRHYTFDGFLTYSTSRWRSGAKEGYTLAFHNGIIEAVDTYMLMPSDELGPMLRSRLYESQLADLLPRYLTAQKNVGVQPPVAIMLSLVGVKGYQIDVDGRDFGEMILIDRNVLDMSEVLLDDLSITRDNAATILRPIFDAVWNAAGRSRSLNYDADGHLPDHSRSR